MYSNFGYSIIDTYLRSRSQVGQTLQLFSDLTSTMWSCELWCTDAVVPIEPLNASSSVFTFAKIAMPSDSSDCNEKKRIQKVKRNAIHGENRITRAVSKIGCF